MQRTPRRSAARPSTGARAAARATRCSATVPPMGRAWTARARGAVPIGCVATWSSHARAWVRRPIDSACPRTTAYRSKSARRWSPTCRRCARRRAGNEPRKEASGLVCLVLGVQPGADAGPRHDRQRDAAADAEDEQRNARGNVELDHAGVSSLCPNDCDVRSLVMWCSMSMWSNTARAPRARYAVLAALLMGLAACGHDG